MKKLNLGCGTIILEKWDNLDYESRIDGVIICDLKNRLPYDDNSVDEILTSHFLEHLKLRTEAIPFLQECERVLKPGGVLSIIVPNFEILYKVKMFDYHFIRIRNNKEQMRWLVGATFGEGRTVWDYHVSGWFKERFKELGEYGIIKVDPAAGEPLKVFNNMKLNRIINKWRPHSPYEITAIFNKKSNDMKYTEPSWFNEPLVMGTGFMNPIIYTVKRLPKMIKNKILYVCSRGV